MTVRGGGVPHVSLASMPWSRMGPPPRSFAAMRITASSSGPLAHRIQGCGTNLRAPHAGSPRTSSSRPRQVCRRARSRQGRAFGGADAPSLTAPARDGVSFVRVGTKKRAARSNKETDGQENGYDPCGTPLTKSAPYKRTWVYWRPEWGKSDGLREDARMPVSPELASRRRPIAAVFLLPTCAERGHRQLQRLLIAAQLMSGDLL